MKQSRDGGGMSARASAAVAPTFPREEDGASDPPSHADSSHVARRRVASAPAHEVDFDEIQLFDDAPAPFPTLLSVPPRTSRPPPLPTLVPAIPSQAPFDLPLAKGAPPRKRSRSFLGAVLGGALLLGVGLAAGLALRPSALPASVPAVAPVTVPPVTAAAEPAAPPSIEPSAAAPLPTPDATALEATKAPPAVLPALPAATEGLVNGAPGHRLWVDGVLAASWQASVGCGPHLVQVGSAGTPRKVDVPCGEEITVTP
jgi:hypothetical protein